MHVGALYPRAIGSTERSSVREKSLHPLDSSDPQGLWRIAMVSPISRQQRSIGETIESVYLPKTDASP